jgi:hypothetical protein
VSDGQQNTPAASGSPQQRTILRRTRKSGEYRRIRSGTYCAGAIIRTNIRGIPIQGGNRKMKRIWVVSAIFGAVLTLAIPTRTVQAQEGLQQLAAQFVQWALSIPNDANPSADQTGDFCNENHQLCRYSIRTC